MALTSARNILNKKILGMGGASDASEISIDIAGLSASKLDIGLSEILDDINQVDEKVENVTEYSSTERVVGKWIDGSDIYEKTIIVTSGITGDTTIDHGITDLDLVISIEGFMNASVTGGQMLNCPALTSSAAQFTPQYATCIKDINDTNLTFSVGASRLSQGVKNVIVTIKYTKASAESKKKTTKKK